jgi:hypothetical protein
MYLKSESYVKQLIESSVGIADVHRGVQPRYSSRIAEVTMRRVFVVFLVALGALVAGTGGGAQQSKGAPLSTAITPAATRSS